MSLNVFVHIIGVLRFIPARALHIGMLIATIMAFSSPGADSTTNYIATEEGIEWPSSIQQSEIALVSLTSLAAD
jgi:hypothetical protein